MFNHELILNHIDDIFGQDMHAKRVLSLANATLGVIESGSLAIHAIVTVHRDGVDSTNSSGNG